MTLHRTHRSAACSPASRTVDRAPTDVPSPVVWRYSRSTTESPLLSSHQSSLISMSHSKGHFLSPLRILIAIAIVVYIFLPSRILRQITKHPSVVSVSDAGRKVIESIQTSVTSTTSSSDPSHTRRGECHVDDSQTPSVCIVASCQNRHEVLQNVLPSWLAVEGVHQIVIVDWSSEPSLRSIVRPRRDERIKLIRVNNESSWVLSRAYNLGVESCSCGYVLRTDCDYGLQKNVLKFHNVSRVVNEHVFYTGNWLTARDENEIHLNGALLVKRDVFLSVGGYDERIQTYGWDDEDLYNRLIGRNFKRLNLSYDYISHHSHDDSSRAQTGVKFAQVQIDVNQLLLEQLTPWSKTMREGLESSSYNILRDEDGSDGRVVEVTAQHIPLALKDRLPAHEYDKAWDLSLGRRLADDYRVPWDMIATMKALVRERLLRSLMGLQVDLDMAAQNGTKTMTVRAGKRVRIPSRARLLIVHCQHGLGNRLRALGSAMAFARQSRRIVVAIWQQDIHVAAKYHSLFERSDLIVLSAFTPKWPFIKLHEFDSAWSQFKFYNYMEMEPEAKKGELIVNDVDKHIYYKGAYIMEAPDYTWWESANEELRSLRPVQMVRDKLQMLEEKGIRNAIGVHIRNRTLDHDIENVDFDSEYGHAAAEEMEQWRQRSSFLTFSTEMERILREEDKDAQFYIATDTWQLLDIMERRFPGRIICTKRTCDDRLSECVKYALVDLYALGYTRKLLGSNWSSFTEAAQRFGGKKALLSGVDFGNIGSGNKSQLQPEAQKSLVSPAAKQTDVTAANRKLGDGNGDESTDGVLVNQSERTRTTSVTTRNNS